MTRPYSTRTATVTYVPLVDEAALVVRRTQRRAGLSTISGKPRAIYGARKTPFADDVVVGLYRLHREERMQLLHDLDLAKRMTITMTPDFPTTWEHVYACQE